MGAGTNRIALSGITVVFLAALLQISFVAEATAADNAPATSQEWVVRTDPPSLLNGAPVLFRVTPSAPLKSLTGTWLGHTVVFSSGASEWFALAGISLETKPGAYDLILEGRTADGNSHHFEQRFAVGPASYPTVELTVSKKFTAPSPEQSQQIREDQELKQKVFSRTTPEREWAGRFEPPVEAPISDVFGTRRVFNGVTKSVHQGLDYRVPPATPVSAVNKGTVILARPLYFEGNCVVLDHGQGLLSLYFHLAEIGVQEGERVERGQQIGLSGATGRATGPHLHMAVRWQGVYLNPAVLLSLPLP
ncbi:MAG TPA: M23 family metallopeptidase [Terriglobales bacterium]|nr:M23 family metallopeptidase [Terriglobales bacterium]